MSGELIMLAGRCGRHFNKDCDCCQAAQDCTNHEMGNLRAEIERLRAALEKIAKGIPSWNATEIARKALGGNDE